MAVILTEADLAPLFRTAAAMDELLKMIEEALRAHNRNEVAGQSRMEISLVDRKRKFRFMTAAVPAAGYGMRINALFSGAKDGYFHLLFDGESGNLLALMAGRDLNVWRTGAPAGVASRYLAPPQAKTMALLGSGGQARGQLLAIHRALPSLERVRVFSPTQGHREAFAKEMSAWLGIAVEAVNDPQTALRDAAIVGVATNSRRPVLEFDWISRGALVVSITSGQLPQDLVAHSRVIVSWKEEVLAGESPREPYATMIAAGTWSGEAIAGELGEVMLGRIPARVSESETVLFECVGMPVLDVAATTWAYRWAAGRQLGLPFSLD
jgi:ornithine cyclodeaminase/alanine dehydrogenase-like protein (mu-crystallin family)